MKFYYNPGQWFCVPARSMHETRHIPTPSRASEPTDEELRRIAAEQALVQSESKEAAYDSIHHQKV